MKILVENRCLVDPVTEGFHSHQFELTALLILIQLHPEVLPG